MKIAENYKIWFSISLVIILIGLGFALINGVNLGIDFTGGTSIQIDLGKTVPVEEVQELIEAFDLDATIVHAGDANEEVIIKTSVPLTNDERVALFGVFQEAYGLTNDAYLGSSQFGPSIGKELQNKALLSILIASVGMLAYITFRFEIIYGFSAIIALLHDVCILLAVYSIFNISITSSFIASVLTIVGYSINDTIVVFDRVRENMRTRKKQSYFEVANKSLEQTIHRSINTSLTTLLIIGSLYVFGAESIKDFAFPLMAGVLAGTYSSIFIASPIWALLKTRSEKKNARYAAN